LKPTTYDDGSVQAKQVLKRLAKYALLFKKRIVIAMLILVTAVSAQLAGPYIAKIIIDKHILAIQEPWYEAPAGQAGLMRDGSLAPSVEWHDKAYVREDWLLGQPAPESWSKARIVQQEGGLYMESGNVKTKLASTDVIRFYQHDVEPVMKLLGLYLGFIICASALTFTQSYLLQTTAVTIIQKLRMEVMGHIHRLPVRYFDNTPVGAIVSRIANDTEAIKELFMSFMATFLVSGVNLIGIYTALFILDWRLALMCLPIVPLIAAIMWFHLKYSKVYISIMRARLSDMNAMLNESIKVMPIIQAFRREQSTLDEFDALNTDRYTNQIKQNRLFAMSSRNIVGMISALTIASVLWFFGNQALAGLLTFGVFYAFIDYLSRIFQPIIGIFDQMTNAQRAFVSSERVFALLNQPPEHGAAIDTLEENAEQAEHEARPDGHVRFERVDFAYTGNEYVLKQISFEAKQGETIALVGHTGSGKSSIMNLLLGFYTPTNGRITIDGKDIMAMSKADLRRHMGIVLQDPFLFAGDIAFNVSLYNDRVDLDKVRHALREVGAEPFVQALPGGYKAPVLERGSTLSAGQRQLISFARALAHDPAILILDEATSSIDSETEGIIQQALKVLCKGRTTFVIAHRLSTIRDADRIIVLHKGEIVETGTHDELMKLGGRYYTMYQLQKGGTQAS
jgi:ATP-binding cassette, subfamily B, multidrug efflux pump